MKKLNARLSSFGLAILLVGATTSKPASAFILHLINFQANAIAVYQTSGGNSYSGQVAWTPYINLGIIGFRGDFGITLLKNGLGNRFVATNVEGLVSLPFLPPLSLEVGGGLHTWTSGNGGTHPALTGNVVFNTVPGIDRIFVGYSRFFLDNAANEIRAGIGFAL